MIFKKGDKVYDHAYGWGEVIKGDDDHAYPLKIEFQHIELYYNVKGVAEFGFLPTLSFTEYTLEGFSQVRPKEPLPFDRWYIWDEYPNQIMFEGRYIRYGLTYMGGWRYNTDNYPRPMSKLIRLATDAEILEKLSAYATSIGIMAGATFVALGRDFRIKIEDKPSIGFTYNTEYNSLLFDGWLIMRDGKWVAVVEETKTLAEEIQAIKKHLGI